VYPNPAKDYVTINTNSKNENAYLTITDAVGKLLKKILVKSDSINVNTSSFLNGLYHIQIVKNNQLVCDYPLIIAK
jgi:hypothetical protein